MKAEVFVEDDLWVSGLVLKCWIEDGEDYDEGVLTARARAEGANYVLVVDADDEDVALWCIDDEDAVTH